MKNEKGQEVGQTFDQKMKIMDLAITASQSILEMVDLINNDEPKEKLCPWCGNKFDTSE